MEKQNEHSGCYSLKGKINIGILISDVAFTRKEKRKTKLKKTKKQIDVLISDAASLEKGKQTDGKKTKLAFWLFSLKGKMNACTNSGVGSKLQVWRPYRAKCKVRCAIFIGFCDSSKIFQKRAPVRS